MSNKRSSTMNRRSSPSVAYATLMIFGSVILAVIIYFADAGLTAQTDTPKVNPIAEIEGAARSAQGNIGEAVGLTDAGMSLDQRLANIRNSLPQAPTAEPTPEIVAVDQSPQPDQFSVGAPTEAPREPDPTQPPPTPQIVERIVYVEVTAAAPVYVPPPTPIPQPVYQAPPVQQASYQPVQASTEPSQWQPFQIGHNNGRTYIYTTQGLWMECGEIFMEWGGNSARTQAGSRFEGWFNGLPRPDQLRYFNICDNALRQEGKR